MFYIYSTEEFHELMNKLQKNTKINFLITIFTTETCDMRTENMLCLIKICRLGHYLSSFIYIYIFILFIYIYVYIYTHIYI